MLLDIMHYSGIYAKICALKSNFLTYDDYYKLSSCENVKDLIQMLGQKDTYRESVDEAMAHGTNRVAFERSLYRVLYRDYTAIFSFLTRENERCYLDAIFLKYEINLIKRMLRRLYDQRDIQNVLPKSDKYLSNRLKLDVERLGASTSFESFMEALEGTEFYDVLAKVNSEKGSLFDYEMQLDFHRYMKMQKYRRKYLDRSNAASQLHLMGSEADLLNIMCIYRAKFYYNIDADKIFSYLIPINYRLKTEAVKDLVGCENGDFLSILETTYYKGVFKDMDADSIDMYFNKYMDKQHDRERKRNPYSLAIVTWHLHYKMQEIKNITTLTECVRYKLPSKAAMSRLNINFSREGEGFD